MDGWIGRCWTAGTAGKCVWDGQWEAAVGGGMGGGTGCWVDGWTDREWVVSREHEASGGETVGRMGEVTGLDVGMEGRSPWRDGQVGVVRPAGSRCSCHTGRGAFSSHVAPWHGPSPERLPDAERPRPTQTKAEGPSAACSVLFLNEPGPAFADRRAFRNTPPCLTLFLRPPHRAHQHP